ncbi:MAG: ABC transporter ATP-binding protein/permease [Clostridiales bacterium]|nr:ABC transporter ATP-binding protein/permease [Clostridiales bacterium]
MLKLQNITKNYTLAGNTFSAVSNLNLQFRRSEFVSILGPSGCGKTTTMNIIGGLDRYTSGDLIIEGVSTKNYQDSDWDNYRNKKVGFVFQSYNLIPQLTVLGNVEIALSIAGISATSRRSRAIEALTSVGLREHIKKRPNQLSGGQMQRVAIARAIVNSPEILLMDEPTGALDTNTSEQIMQLIKRIAKDKLVIMVTHNSELAQNFSTRIIQLKDGVLSSDSNPYFEDENTQNSKKILGDVADITDKVDSTSDNIIEDKKELNVKKSSMSFFTSVKLSGQNLLTKKKRGILTSIASAIGIIGIGLILALSNGLGTYIEDMTRAEAESSPITISDYVGDVIGGYGRGDIGVNQTTPPRERIRLSKQGMDFALNTYGNGIEKDWLNDRIISTGIHVPVYVNSKPFGWQLINNTLNDGMGSVNLGGIVSFGLATVQRMPNNLDLVSSQFELLYGTIPNNFNQIAVVLNNDGTINDDLAKMLGLLSLTDTSTQVIDSEKILSANLRVYNNEQILNYDEQKDSLLLPPFAYKNTQDLNLSDEEFLANGGVQLKVSGIIRLREGRKSGVLTPGIALHGKLYTHMQQLNQNSQIVEWMKLQKKDNYGKIIRPIQVKSQLSGDDFVFADNNTATIPLNNQFYVVKNTAEFRWELVFRQFGGMGDIPLEIHLFANNYQNKQNIIHAVDQFNRDKEVKDRINAVDLVEMIASFMSQFINIVSVVLIGFTAVSLIVSAVMIAIITSISVLERTKEIGILRSIGARKKDVTRLFNAENLILGLMSGLVGVVSTFFLSMLAGWLLAIFADMSGLAVVAWWHILLLLGVSTVITLISGFMPSKAAAKKDPVLALRSE